MVPDLNYNSATSAGVQSLPKWPGLLLVLVLFIIGLAIYKDYGVSWDELSMRQVGEVNVKFMRSGDDALMQGFSDKDHGASFEVPLMWIEEIMKPAHIGVVIQIRHLCTFLFYVLGIWCGYLLALRLFRKQWLALLAVLMLVLEPRLFAHAFFNSKDIPFLSSMLIALYGICVAFQERKYQYYVLAGAACGFAIGIRTPGIILAGPAALLMAGDILKEKGTQRKKAALRLVSFLSVLMLVLYACWPALWHHPFTNIYESLRSFTNYAKWDHELMFDGIMRKSVDLPWHYLPAWIAITTPVAWLAFGLTGMFLGIRAFIRRPGLVMSNVSARILLLCGITFAVPIVAAIAMHSVLYDDWRHFYFVYPSLVMLALNGADSLARSPVKKKIIMALCGAQAIVTIWFMVSAHPFQEVYFNRLVSHHDEYLRQHYDFDYWGASYKQGLEWVLAHDTRDTIAIEDSSFPLFDNWKAMKATTKKQIRWTDHMTPGSYFLTNFRGHPDDYSFPKVYGIKVCNSTVMQIYRIPEK
jgi:hypothetical protein